MIATWEDRQDDPGEERCVATPPTLGQGLGPKNHQQLEDKGLLKFQQEGVLHIHKRVPLRTCHTSPRINDYELVNAPSSD